MHDLDPAAAPRGAELVADGCDAGPGAVVDGVDAIIVVVSRTTGVGHGERDTSARCCRRGGWRPRGRGVAGRVRGERSGSHRGRRRARPCRASSSSARRNAGRRRPRAAAAGRRCSVTWRARRRRRTRSPPRTWRRSAACPGRSARSCRRGVVDPAARDVAVREYPAASSATARTSRRPSATVVVSKSQVNGAGVSVQASVQVLAPAGEVWKRTLAMPRSEAAVAASARAAAQRRAGIGERDRDRVEVRRRGEGVPGFALAATKVAPEARTRNGTTRTRSAKAKRRASRRRLRRRAWCRARAGRGWRARSAGGDADQQHPQRRSESAASAKPA